MDDRAEAEAYAAADFREVNEAFVERLLGLAGPREEQYVLDLGTGPADIPIRVMRRRPYWRVTAVDSSQAMVDIAAKAVAEAGLSGLIGLIVSDVKSLPVPSSEFDVVFSNAALHHVTDADGFWTEVQRVERPGAVVFVRDLARPCSVADAQRIVDLYAANESDLLRAEFVRSLLASYTPEEVRLQLEAAGLERLQVVMASDRHLDVFGRLP